MTSGEKFVGVDIDDHNVAWCKRAYDGMSVFTIDPDLSAPFDDASFDFIYGQSVFTHLTEAAQDSWLVELRWLLRPGGVCAVTIAAELAWSVMLRGQRSAEQYAEFVRRGIRDSGWLDVGVDQSKPGYYRNTWHTVDYVTRRWSRFLEILHVIDGFADSQTMVVMRRHAA